jgi:hypothetical protein
MMRKVSAIVLVTAWVTACGGSSAEFTGGTIAIAELPDQLATALCKAEKACSPFFYRVAFSSADCKTTVSEQLRESTFTQIQVAVDAKTVTYDGAKAESCIEAVAEGSCAVLDNHLPTVCREALAGTVAAGGDCDIDAQCTGLSRCEVTGGACPGKCAPLVTAGVACTRDGDCALGLTCSEATGHCSAPAAAGEPCKGGSGAECAAGLLCVGNDDDKQLAGSCKTEADALVGKVGESCDLQQGPWCATGLSCVVEAVLPAAVYKCHAQAAAGGVCGLGVPSECPAGQYCPVDFGDLITGMLSASCTALPSEGEPCAPAVALTRCAGNLVCDDTTAVLAPVCVTLHSLGQSCSSDTLCKSKHCVDQVCVPESICAK